MGSDSEKKAAKPDKADVEPAEASADVGADVMPGDEDFDVIVAEEFEFVDDVSATMASFISGRVEADIVQSNISAVGTVSSESIEANLSAIGLAKTEDLTVVGSVVGIASTEGDTEINTSATPLVITKGDASFHQAYASAFIAGGCVDIRQGGSPIIVGKQLSVEQGGGLVMLASEAQVNRGFVGLLVSPNATVSDDSRVLLSTKAAIIIAAALLGGFGIVAVAMLLGVRRVMQWRPQISLPSLPSLGDLEHRFHAHRG